MSGNHVGIRVVPGKKSLQFGLHLRDRLIQDGIDSCLQIFQCLGDGYGERARRLEQRAGGIGNSGDNGVDFTGNQSRGGHPAHIKEPSSSWGIVGQGLDQSSRVINIDLDRRGTADHKTVSFQPRTYVQSVHRGIISEIGISAPDVNNRSFHKKGERLIRVRLKILRLITVTRN